jgi:hypothetical protein
MHIEDYVPIGQRAAEDLLSARFSLLAERLGYALAFGRTHANAIQEDYELAASNAGGDSKNGTYTISVKKFIGCEPDFIALIEVEIALVGGAGGVYVEIIEKSRGFYLEEIRFRQP